MDIWLQKIFYSTKDKELRKNRIIKLLGILIVTLLISSIFLLMQKDYVSAASGVRIYNYTTKKEYTYTDMQIKVTYDGKKISVDSTPGLLENSIALVSYKDIFARSPVKAECVYDKPAQTVTISKFDTTIVMKIGSRTAYINGKAVTAPVAPVKIKYVKENVTKILVPSRFVFENLGYDYTWNKSTSTVSVEAKQEPLLLTYNDGDKFTYNGTQGKVTIDGKNINLGKMPSIITNNTAMLRAKRVFADSKINADYKYNSKDKTITLSRAGNKLEMKIGSPVAHLNGRAIVLDTAPMIVTNHETGTSYVMVPGSFTASCLGFDYRWDRDSMTSILTSRDDEVIDDVPQPEEKPNDKDDTTGKIEDKTPDQSKDEKPNQPQDEKPDQPKDEAPGQTQDEAPELGDSAVKWDRGRVISKWEAPKKLKGVSSGVHSIDSSDKANSNGLIYAISKDTSNTKQNTETFVIMANAPFGKITSELKGRQISINIADTTTVEHNYQFTNAFEGMTNNIRAYNTDNKSSRLDFHITSENFTYDLSLSPDSQTLYVTIYFNSLNELVLGTNDTMDYLTLKGDKKLNVIVNRMSGILTVELPRVKQGISDFYTNFYECKSINFLNVFHASESTFIYIGLKDNNEYYLVEEDNSYTIMIPAKNKPFTPVQPTIPKAPEEPFETEKPVVTPESPVVGDGKYELIIPNPAGLTVSQIKHEDQYSKLRFAIRIPGDYVSYFDNNKIVVNSNVIKDVTVFLNSKSETEILVTTSRLQGYELHTDANNIYVNIGNPREIYKNIVVLDPGHGGAAPGAIYNNTREKTINFKILYEIGKDFFNADPSQLKVYYTRESDVDISLADRAAFAKKVGADLFVSLHMNANTNKTVYGTEIYYSSNNNKKNQAGLNSEILAKLFVNNLSSSLKTKNRGIRAARYTVVHNNTVPAILIELGFMSNNSDFDKITNPTFQYNAAKEIHKTLLEVFELYPTGR